MIPNKISGKRLIETANDGIDYCCYANHKHMGNFSRNGMKNWGRYYTKKLRKNIKNETNKELNESD